MQTRHAAEPNVTPMIDVLLVLIVAFMVLVAGGRRTMDVQLPEQCRVGCESGETIVLEVLGRGAYRVNQQPVQRAALEPILTGIYRKRPSKILSVVGRSNATFSEVMEAMDVARSAGVRVVSAVPKDLQAAALR
jgi:biopolymer transport protein ExbD